LGIPVLVLSNLALFIFIFRRSSFGSSEHSLADMAGPSRPFTLAEAMQAARRLQQEQLKETTARTEEKAEQEEEEEEMEEEEDTVEDDNDDNEEEDGLENAKDDDEDQQEIDEEEEEGEEEGSSSSNSNNSNNDSSSDLAKNIEIRRLSSTEDGDKIIEPTFHSPEKEAGRPRKNPLENILNFVSGMEMPVVEERPPRGSHSPLVMGLKGRRSRQPQQQQQLYSALPHSPAAPWVVRPAAQLLPLFHPAGTAGGAGGHAGLRPAAPGQTMLIAAAPQLQYHQPTAAILPAGGQAAAYGQPPAAAATIMQLIQTVNGPMLVPLSAAPQQQQPALYQLQPNMEEARGSPSSSSSSSPASSHSVTPTKMSRGKGGGGNRKRKATDSVSQQMVRGQQQQQPATVISLAGGQLPLLLSPSGQQGGGGGGLVSLQPFIGQQALPVQQQAGEPPHQLIQLHHNILPQQQQQHHILLPAQQPAGAGPVVYQQLPDGTLVQLPLQPQIIHSAPVGLPPPHGGGPIFVNSGAAAGGGGQIIMTPQGLIHTFPGTQPIMFQPQAVAAALAPARGRTKAARQPPPASKRPRRDPIAASSVSSGQSLISEDEPVTDRSLEPDEEGEEEEENEDVEKEEEEEEEGEEREQASMDETDTSYEEAPRPSGTSSRRSKAGPSQQHQRPASSSSIQSNKVDSSGLNATPPHQKEQPSYLEQLRGSSSGAADESLELLDTSYLDMSRNSEEAGGEEDSDDDEEEEQQQEQEQQQDEEEDQQQLQQEQQQQQQQHVSSSVKKKKKKKSADDYLAEQSILYGKLLSVIHKNL
jgi:hypothetical protein